MISTQVQIKEAQLKDEADREKRRQEKLKLKQAAATGVHEVTEAGFDLDDMMANDDIEEEDEENVPPPVPPKQLPTVRPTKRVANVNHTPRVFPTPMRESKLKEENAWVQNCVEIKIYGAFVLNRRVVLHAIDATPARRRGGVNSSPLDRAKTAASSPRNDLVKNCRVHPTHWLISTQVQKHRQHLHKNKMLFGQNLVGNCVGINQCVGCAAIQHERAVKFLFPHRSGRTGER